MISLETSNIEPLSKPKEGTEEIDEKSKNKKPKKLPKITINTSRSRGEMKLIQLIIENNQYFGWKTASGLDGDVMWSGLDIPWEETLIATEIMLNRIPGIADISEKKATGFYLNKFREYYPDQFDFFPKTFLLPEEIEQFQEYFKSHPKKIFISKPTAGCQGYGINLIKKLSDLPMTTLKDIVVQEYIDNPLLIEGKKFDLRLYVLISNVKPAIAFLNDEGLARFCTENYEKPNQSNITNMYMHLTNYSLNKNSPNFKYTEECREINDGSKRTLTSFWKSVDAVGVDKSQILTNIRSILQKLLISILPYIQFSYNVAFEGKDNGKCFHVLGIDVLIDSNLKPWVLEINANPSMSIDFDGVSPEENKKKQTVLVSPVDYYVKSRVMEDAILIAKKSAEKQAALERYGTFVKLFDSDGQTQMSIFKDILEIFGKLSGSRFKTSLSSSKFNKLSTLEGLTITNFIKVDYDILYKRLCKESPDKQMNFATFMRAIEVISTRINKDLEKREAVISLLSLIKSQMQPTPPILTYQTQKPMNKSLCCILLRDFMQLINLK